MKRDHPAWWEAPGSACGGWGAAPQAVPAPAVQLQSGACQGGEGAAEGPSPVPTLPPAPGALPKLKSSRSSPRFAWLLGLQPPIPSLPTAPQASWGQGAGGRAAGLRPHCPSRKCQPSWVAECRGRGCAAASPGPGGKRPLTSWTAWSETMYRVVLGLPLTLLADSGAPEGTRDNAPVCSLRPSNLMAYLWLPWDALGLHVPGPFPVGGTGRLGTRQRTLPQKWFWRELLSPAAVCHPPPQGPGQ